MNSTRDSTEKSPFRLATVVFQATGRHNVDKAATSANDGNDFLRCAKERIRSKPRRHWSQANTAKVCIERFVLETYAPV